MLVYQVKYLRIKSEEYICFSLGIYEKTCGQSIEAVKDFMESL